MKLSNLFKKKPAKNESEVVKIDKKLLQKIVGGTEPTPIENIPVAKKMMGAAKISEATN